MKAQIKKKFSTLLIRKIFISCCFDELKVIKPGNLSFNSPIYGMNKKFFFRASELSAPILTKKESLGKKIFSTTNLCLTELKSNYNLGIILLCAPIIDVALNGFKNIQDLKKKLHKLLINIDNKNGRKILESIKISKPAGINNYVGKLDIKKNSRRVNFKESMEIGSKWDRISKCYVETYSEIFKLGLPFFQRLKKKFSYGYSIQCLFIFYLALDLDSHLMRKWGVLNARTVQVKAKFISKQIFKKRTVKTLKIISDFDIYLKKRNFNPGTCADLTVTTLLMDKITDIVRPYNLNKCLN